MRIENRSSITVQTTSKNTYPYKDYDINNTNQKKNLPSTKYNHKNLKRA